MNVATSEITSSNAAPVVLAGSCRPEPKTRPLHRIATARRQQGMSLRSVARQMERRVSSVRTEEVETQDLRLSDLLRWQRVLRVPLQDLLIEPENSLSKPVEQRAQLLRVMKTAAALDQMVEGDRAKRLTAQLVRQLVEMMPELKSVAAWNSVGQRRSPTEYGRVVETVVSRDTFAR